MQIKFPDRKDAPFWLFTFSIIIILTLPKLIQDGMFMDGMLYTSVSHNLSRGIGTFWFPVFSPSWPTKFFLEQPPLVYGIQSVFFRVMGNSMYVERAYIFFTMCLTAFLIYLLWKIIYRNEDELKRVAWFPLLIWMSIPSCSWSYSNNMMENSMGVFGLASIIALYKALESNENRFGFLLLSGILLFLATFSKGVPALFPLAVPFLHWLIFRQKSFAKILVSTFVLLSVPAIIYFVLLQFPESRESLKYYFTQRLLGRIQDAPTVGNRFYIINRLFQELIPLIILVSTSIIIIRYYKLKLHTSHDLRKSVFFLSIGLAASAPLMLTLVQRGFYLVPSFPYFALGFSIILSPVILILRNKILNSLKGYKIFFILSAMIFFLAIAVTVMEKGKTSRDRDILHDVYAIGKAIPENSKIRTTLEITSSFVLECYFIRYFNISLFTDQPQEFYMTDKATSFSDKGYEKLKIETILYDIYRRK
jgi:4-amino-4-deoxy-L-arabinose transferase-like glycosyltransferase